MWHSQLGVSKDKKNQMWKKDNTHEFKDNLNDQ